MVEPASPRRTLHRLRIEGAWPERLQVDVALGVKARRLIADVLLDVEGRLEWHRHCELRRPVRFICVAGFVSRPSDGLALDVLGGLRAGRQVEPAVVVEVNLGVAGLDNALHIGI